MDVEAGRQTDTRIAEKVMGFSEIWHGTMPPYWDGDAQRLLPHYSADIAAAWEVVERMASLGFIAKLWSPGRDVCLPHFTRSAQDWECSFWKYVNKHTGEPYNFGHDGWDNSREIIGKGINPSPSLAICRAALKAVEKERAMNKGVISMGEPVHGWFGLSYSQYLTVPRSVLQSMPTEWQERFVRCLEEMDEAIDWRPREGRYWVRLKDARGRFVHDSLMDYERGRRRVRGRATDADH